MQATSKNPATKGGADLLAGGIGSNPNGKKPSPQAAWRARNPLARWAHQCVQSAIRLGLLEREACEVCGAIHGVDGAIVDGHHDAKLGGYEKPLVSIRWLCRRHHAAAHRAIRCEAIE